MLNIDTLPLNEGGKSLNEELNRHILVLDGAMGTMIQSHNLNEQDFRGQKFTNSPVALKGLNDLLVLTRPDVITSIHRQYI
ncbi:MAG: homocysteine S-methyltransferase family protein, partial [Muribaculaceae bacterium]|nr:homocysteine S-methyltransferase family protein [Muribaculaceae bacterium]